jgi:hypothetical protein
MIEYKVRVHLNGDRSWCLNGNLHREDGPAIEKISGTKFWYLNGKLHREDGPAIEYYEGNKRWYLKGIRYNEEQFNKKINPKDCSGSSVIVDGVEYTLNRKS